MTTKYARPQTTPRELVQLWCELYKLAGLHPDTGIEGVINSARNLRLDAKFGNVYVVIDHDFGYAGDPTKQPLRVRYGWTADPSPGVRRMKQMAANIERALAFGQTAESLIRDRRDLYRASLMLADEIRHIYDEHRGVPGDGCFYALHTWLQSESK